MAFNFKTLFKLGTLFSTAGMIVSSLAENQQKKEEQEQKERLERRVLQLEEKQKETEEE